jgi:hypothetical protein
MARNAVTARSGETGAHAILSGFIGNGVSWFEDIAMTEDGTAIAGSPASWTWTMTLRESNEDDSAVLTLTTADYLTVVQGSTETTLQIRVPAASVASLEGDYVVDLKSLDTTDDDDDPAGRSRHWAHGMITVRNEP